MEDDTQTNEMNKWIETASEGFSQAYQKNLGNRAPAGKIHEGQRQYEEKLKKMLSSKQFDLIMSKIITDKGYLTTKENIDKFKKLFYNEINSMSPESLIEFSRTSSTKSLEGLENETQ